MEDGLDEKIGWLAGFIFSRTGLRTARWEGRLTDGPTDMIILLEPFHHHVIARQTSCCFYHILLLICLVFWSDEEEFEEIA
jgi:hypothetical protein